MPKFSMVLAFLYRPCLCLAVKCNPLPGMLDAFATFPYASFDCASKEEMESVLIRFISPEQIVYANPMKVCSSVDMYAV